MTVKVLIVEDEELAAEAHAEFTRRVDGFEVVAVTRSAGEAVRQLTNGPPVDLILLDMHLPDGHGLAAAAPPPRRRPPLRRHRGHLCP